MSFPIVIAEWRMQNNLCQWVGRKLFGMIFLTASVEKKVLELCFEYKVEISIGEIIEKKRTMLISDKFELKQRLFAVQMRTILPFVVYGSQKYIQPKPNTQ